MKKRFSFLLTTIAAFALAFPAMSFAADISKTSKTQDIPIGSSGESSAIIEMIGTIEPTIMSVTMPTFVPFHISNSISGQNKVLSPRIEMTNNSTVPVKINVTYAQVDLSELENTTWSDNGTVKDNQIAIGFKEETTFNEQPTDLNLAKWLSANKSQNSNILILDSNQKGAVYVVGTLGTKVSENSTFSVIPTLIVSKTSDIK